MNKHYRLLAPLALAAAAVVGPASAAHADGALPPPHVGPPLAWGPQQYAFCQDPALAAAAGYNVFVLTALNDVFVGTPGNDAIYALAGNDSVNGAGGDDVICLGPGNDKGRGGAGNDAVFGEDGRDSLQGNGGDDFLDCGIDVAVDAANGGAGVNAIVNCP